MNGYIKKRRFRELKYWTVSIYRNKYFTDSLDFETLGSFHKGSWKIFGFFFLETMADDEKSMSEDALGEFEALQSIYDGDIVLLNPTVFEIDVSNDISKDTKLRVGVAEDPISPYPLSAPKLTVSAPWMTRDKKKATEEKLREIYTGSECVLECVELLKELAEEVAQVDEILLRREEEAKERFNKQSEKMGLEKEVEIFQGEPLVVKKSKFIAHCAIVNSVEEVNYFKNRILESKKYQDATHNILAYRFSNYEVRDDDGETGAGDKLLNFLQSANIVTVAVMVTRWYGGILLGPQRFRCIIQAATSSLQRAGLAAAPKGKQ